MSEIFIDSNQLSCGPIDFTDNNHEELAETFKAIGKLKAPKTKNPYSSELNTLLNFAQEHGLFMIMRFSNQVLVDIDSPTLPVDWDQRLSMVHALEPIMGWSRNQSRGGNIHVTVNFEHDVKPQDALMYEAILGSDFKRVALGYKSLHENGGQFMSFFFEKPGVNPTYVVYQGDSNE
jgi:hypothetical protein